MWHAGTLSGKNLRPQHAAGYGCPMDDTSIQPSGICRAGKHVWRHDPPSSKRRTCIRCRSMSMINYPCGADCIDCHPPAPAPVAQ